MEREDLKRAYEAKKDQLVEIEKSVALLLKEVNM